MHRIVLSDRKVKLRELAEAVGISKEWAEYISHDVLEMKKLSARWVPRLLTVDQKQNDETSQRDDSMVGLALLQRNRADFFRRFVTMDETWVHYHTPKAICRVAEKPRKPTKAVKRPTLGQKGYGLRFLGCAWHNLHRLPAEGKNTGEYYAALLDKLNDEIKKKRPHMAKKKVLYTITIMHTSLKAMAKLD